MKVWPLLFWKFTCFCFPSKRPNFPFGPWTIVHGDQKIELAQKKIMQVEVGAKCMQAIAVPAAHQIQLTI